MDGRNFFFLSTESPYCILVDCKGMYFGPGKRKGYSSFKVVDRSNKSRRSTVDLPSALPPEQEVQPREQEEEAAGSYLQ